MANLRSVNPNILDVYPSQEPWAVVVNDVNVPDTTIAVILTANGLVMDFFDSDNNLKASVSMTYSEWLTFAQDLDKDTDKA